MSRKPRIFTLGHSNLSFEAFFHILEASSIRFIVDVRFNPAFGRFLHFERSALSSALGERGLSYRLFRGLGGRAPESLLEDEHATLETPEFRRYALAMCGRRAYQFMRHRCPCGR